MRIVVILMISVVLGLAGGEADAGSKKKHPPTSVSGKFDYYVLSLSWSPVYCETHSSDTAQCGNKRFGFVLHGLWPQYTNGGYPEICSTDNQLDEQARSFGNSVFPSEKLVAHEWQRHGTCSGMTPMDYFKTANTAHQSIVIPPRFEPGTRVLNLEVPEISKAIRQANPGITNSGMAVVCSGPELAEVRICLDKGLKPMACGGGVKDSCRPGTRVRIPGAQ